MSDRMSDEQIRIWINACNSEVAREALRELLAFRVGGKAAPLKQRAMQAALKAAEGYLLNAKIDLETGAPKRTAIQTIEGGLKRVRDALSFEGEVA